MVQEKIDRIDNPYPDTEINYNSSVMKTMSDIYQCTNCNGTNFAMANMQEDLRRYSEMMDTYAKNIQKQLEGYQNQVSQAINYN